MATVADLEEMQASIGEKLKSDVVKEVSERALAVVDEKMIQQHEHAETASRVVHLEKSTRQLGQTCRNMKVHQLCYSDE